MATIYYTAKVREERLLELPQEAKELHLTPGAEVQIQLERLYDAAPNVNVKMQAILRMIKERHKNRPYTNGSDTQRFINEARGGALYGYDSAD